MVAILGIIAAIAFPSYQSSVRKSRRADGTGKLLEIANQFERCYTIDGRYDGPTCPAAGGAIDTSDAQYYNIDIARTRTTFNLTATASAVGGQNADTAACLVFTLDETGAKTPDPAADPFRCWNQ